ncbi:MAG: hypothetical protein ACSHYA_05345 [Opitutaceae bacterium]
MSRVLYIICFFAFAVQAFAQTSEPAAPELPTATVQVDLKGKTWFTDRAGIAVVWFDEPVIASDHYSSSTSQISILNIDTTEEANNKTGRYAAIIRYLPRRTGTVTLPSLQFTGTETVYETTPIDFEVSAPVQSDQMSLSITPEKQIVYTGEPVLFTLVWECSINASELQALKLYPEFFNDSNIEIVIPRNTDDESKRVGLPIGGRRIIANRTLNADNNKALGRIELPLYLRFAKPGNYQLSETRLECARLANAGSEFARYAAHFNNALFDAVDSDRHYSRIYTTSPAIDIEVRPLPTNDTGSEFTGLFAPIEFEVSASPTEIEIGQLMEFEIKVNSYAPHGMIELPTLSTQSGLRERFLVDNNLGRIWHSKGSTFRARLRPLSTTIQAIPSLQFSIFNPESHAFEIRTTSAIPLKTFPSGGADYIPLKNFQGAAVTLTNQPAGIWHNLKANRMNDSLNTLFDLLSRNFWIFMLLGPIGFLALLPLVRERRRRDLDRNYRLRADAYKQFKQTPPNSPERWSAFLGFMAATFNCNGKAWTLSDSVKALRAINAPDAEIEEITQLHKAADAQEFGEATSEHSFTPLDSIAKRVFNSAAKLSIFLLAISSLFSAPKLDATEWSDAEALFSEAQNQTAGSAAANALYQQAALKFQAVAANATHTGEALVNAGNAWFQAGAIGRSIASYREALSYRPFDKQLKENLSAARAMTLNDIPEQRTWWQQLPTRWIKVVVVIASAAFWMSLLLAIRYKDKPLIIGSSICGLCFAFVSIFLVQHIRSKSSEGIVVVDALTAKKGPSHTYANAFNEPLHDGAEFTLIEERDAWSHVELSDGRQCWILSSQTKQFEW